MGKFDLTNPLHYIIIGVTIFLVGTALVYGFRWLSKQISKSRRRIRCHLTRVWLSPQNPDGAGGWKPCSYEEATHVDYSASLDIFNEKKIPIVIRNPLVIFEKKDKRVSKKFISRFMEDTNIILQSNEPIVCNIYGTLREDELSDYWVIKDSTNVYLEGRRPNNRKIKIHISGNQRVLVIQDKCHESLPLK